MGYVIDSVREWMKGIESPVKDSVLESLGDAIVVNIQNVSDYFHTTKQDVWELNKDFPVCLPPFERMWMEYIVPEKTSTEKGFVDLLMEGDKISFGAFFRTEKKEQTHRVKVVMFAIFNGSPSILATVFYNVSKDGEILFKFCPDGSIGYFEGSSRIANSPDKYFIPQQIRCVLDPCFLAMSFMSCKNMKTTVLRDSAPALDKKRAKSGKLPLRKVYTLVIEPIKKEIHNASNGDGLSGKALHICRGHFKDFKNGAGLFGRYKGRYWWGSQLKGNAAYGRVEKDYAVNAPARD